MQIQTAIFAYYDSPNQSYLYNPTEAGDQRVALTPYTNPSVYLHGSPLTQMTDDTANDGTGNTRTHQRTRCIPIDFANTGSEPAWSGVNHNHQLLMYDYGLQVGKDVYLSFNGWPTVTKYVSYIYSPSSITNLSSIEMPVMFINARFKYPSVYDAATQTLTTYSADYTEHMFTGNYGGCILSDVTSSSSNAIGLYTVNTNVGGTTGWTDVTGNSSGADNQWGSGYSTLLNSWQGSAETLAAGTQTYPSFIITDTLSNVCYYMHQLYLGRNNTGWGIY
jgi:hypothetical protein